MLRTIAGGIPGLRESDIRKLELLAEQLPLIAELTGNDVFIDCFLSEEEAVVAAQAGPSEERSSYEGSVVGEPALPEKEPAVFRARELDAPVRDIKAITQENKTVRQVVVPVHASDGRVIAVLLQEKDISRDLVQRRKYQELARAAEAPYLQVPEAPLGQDTILLMRETSHRIKNSLQLVSSILNMQARRSGDVQTKEILLENAARIAAISSTQDILYHTGDQKTVEIMPLLEKLRGNLQVLTAEQKPVRIELCGDNLLLDGETAGYTAMVVNELAMNAIEHAFEGRDAGVIRITCAEGKLYHTVTVMDDGNGFRQHGGGQGGTGLLMAEATVREHLHGHMQISSDENGSRISFDLEVLQ